MGDRGTAAFLSAEDFDATGILAGVDPCESRYWWLPELTACAGPADAERIGFDRASADQAAARPRLDAAA